jgi:uncharacterized DUF497 family protein
VGREEAGSQSRQERSRFPPSARAFDRGTVEKVDSRQEYGETRINCLGEIAGRIYAVAYAWRGANRRIISARKANAREQKTYYARVE